MNGLPWTLVTDVTEILLKEATIVINITNQMIGVWKCVTRGRKGSDERSPGGQRERVSDDERGFRGMMMMIFPDTKDRC